MQVFVTRWFGKFAKKERLPDSRICEAVNRAESGLIDADLGGGLIKQRIAGSGGGRSGGFRTLIAFRARDRSIFLYGFTKKERENIGPDDLEDLKNTAAIFLAFNRAELAEAVSSGELKEIIRDG